MIDLSRPVLEIAQALLGTVIRVGPVAIRLTEVEAYAGSDDEAAHSYGGLRPSTKDLFGPPGTLYCYLSYGIHICGNIVCGPGDGSAVLLRAGEVVDGIDVARARRHGARDHALARGPGCFGQAMGWTRASSGGTLGDDYELIGTDNPLYPGAVRSGPRVGISVAEDLPWRFWIAGDPTVSHYRRSPRAPKSRS
ncbi:MAG: DNA-3-methyladenine glycosylase [Propionibacteriaceae bacterium]|jgi:DNA-3-methyladenine glycosylase|nr:DNA-3-methyladenine glycosylase [Propionibacteriaceae bacterium]